jgi:hypothetical protein
VAILTGAILTRFEGVIEATPRVGGVWRKAMPRFELGKQPMGGRDGVYRVEASGIDTARQVFGTGEVVRNLGSLEIQTCYFRGGGSSGGYYLGGDRLNVNKRALDDAFGFPGSLGLVSACEAPLTYDEGNTGIRVVTFQDHTLATDGPLFEIWRTRFNVEWLATTVSS